MTRRTPAPVEGTCPVQIPRSAGGWETCARPLQGGTICRQCMSDLAARVADVQRIRLVLTAIVEGKETAAEAGQGAHALPGPRLPLSAAAYDARADLDQTVLTWGRAIGGFGDAGRRHPEVVQALTEIDRAITAAKRITDPPRAALRPLCPECGERVLMPPDPHDGATLPDGRPVRCAGCITITCSGWVNDEDGFPLRRCGATGNRAWWVAHAGTQEEPATITQLVAKLLTWGHVLKRRRIQDWVDRDLIQPVGQNERGVDVYDPIAAAVIAGRMAAKRRKTRRHSA